MLILLISAITSLSIMIIWISHPLSMGFTLLLMTSITASINSTMKMTSWMSYIMFIVMVGGMLILFIYMTSIASNEKFKLSLNLTVLQLITSTSLIIFMMKNKKILMIENQDMLNTLKNMTTSSLMNKFFNFPSSMMTVFLMMYLLITLIAVTKISSIQKGPLRQKT
uniref:NADH-ubiquinone oxidoreductase chain 6 n=1 Tax=Trinodes hirtus TaxID=442100 RepID=S4SUJ6_9COLE|nr:NADH dehydrogenase subunit 6 [Trinodes hirtus]